MSNRMINITRHARLWRGLFVGLLLLLAALHARAQITNRFSFMNLNRAVPDGSGAGLSFTTNLVSTVTRVSTVRVRLVVDGEFNGDLYAYLRHITTAGTNITILLNRPGRTAINSHGYADAGLDVTFSSAANNIHSYGSLTTLPPGVALTGTWQPDGRKTSPSLVLDTSPRNAGLDGFNGMDGNGEWTLFVADVDSGGTNMLAGWELEIVGQAVPEVTWPIPADLVYGTPLGSSQLNASSSVPGTFSYAPNSGTILSAGSSQKLTVVFTPTDLVNYLKTTNTVLINVQKRSLTITADSKTKVYGTALPVLTISYSGFAPGETSAVLTTQASVATTATPGSPAGDYPITASGAVGANYTISYVPGTLAITAASIAGFVSVSRNPARPGESMTLSYSLSAVAPGSGTPSGSVKFKLDGASLATSPLIGGVASFVTSAIAFGTHTLAAEYAGDNNFVGTTNSLGASLVINTPPQAVADAFNRYPTNGLKISIANLLDNDIESDTSDSIRLVSISPTSALGGTVVSNSTWLFYSPPPGNTNTDTFTYTIADSLGASSIGTVIIKITIDSGPSLSLQITDLGGDRYLIRFDGIPNSSYDIETTPALSPGNWRLWMTVNTDANGIIAVTDTAANGAPSKFYRTMIR